MPVILRREERAVAACGVIVFHLFVGCFHVALLSPALFLSSRTRINSASPAIEAHAVDVSLVNHRAVAVGVVDDHRVDVPNSCVISEHAVLPSSTNKARAVIPEAIVNSTVEPDVRAPVSGVPHVDTVTPTPIARSPKKSGIGRHNPRARHPVVAIRTVSPIARRPKIAGPRANRLLIYRQDWRADSDRHTDRDLR